MPAGWRTPLSTASATNFQVQHEGHYTREGRAEPLPANPRGVQGRQGDRLHRMGLLVSKWPLLGSRCLPLPSAGVVVDQGALASPTSSSRSSSPRLMGRNCCWVWVIIIILETYLYALLLFILLLGVRNVLVHLMKPSHDFLDELLIYITYQI